MIVYLNTGSSTSFAWFLRSPQWIRLLSYYNWHASCSDNSLIMWAIFEDIELEQSVKVTLLANGSKCRSLKTAKLCGESQIVMAKVDTGQKLSLQVDVTGNQVCVVFIVDGVIRRVKPVLGFGGNGETARYIMKTGYMTYAEKGIRRVHMAEFVASPLDDLEIPRTPDSPNPTGVGWSKCGYFIAACRKQEESLNQWPLPISTSTIRGKMFPLTENRNMALFQRQHMSSSSSLVARFVKNFENRIRECFNHSNLPAPCSLHISSLPTEMEVCNDYVFHGLLLTCITDTMAKLKDGDWSIQAQNKEPAPETTNRAAAPSPASLFLPWLWWMGRKPFLDFFFHFWMSPLSVSVLLFFDFSPLFPAYTIRVAEANDIIITSFQYWFSYSIYQWYHSFA